MYTQHCCVYPLLNSALRDHTHPDNLEAFLPYLKLLLKGLNKLPLIRKKVRKNKNQLESASTYMHEINRYIGR